MADKRPHRVGDLWAVRLYRVVEVIRSGRDLRLVSAETGRGHYVDTGDLVYPEHLRAWGFERVASSDLADAAEDIMRRLNESPDGCPVCGNDDEHNPDAACGQLERALAASTFASTSSADS